MTRDAGAVREGRPDPSEGASAPPGAEAGRGRPGSPWRVLATTSLAHFVNDGTAFFVPVMADLLASRGHVSAPVITVMLTGFYLSSSAAGILIGRLADSGGSRGAKMAMGILGLAAGLLLFAAAVGAPDVVERTVLALLAALVAGVGSSVYHPLGASLIIAAFPPRGRARALGANGAMGSLGRALYPTLFFAVTGLIASQTGAVVVFAAVAAGAAVLLWTTRVDSRPAGGRVPTSSQRPRVLPRGPGWTATSPS